MEAAELQFLGEEPEFHQQNAAEYAGNKAWNAVIKLSRNTYWTRVWVVQEVVLARMPEVNILYWGEHALTFQQLVDFHLFARNLVKRKSPKPLFFDKRVWDWVTLDGFLWSLFITSYRELRQSKGTGDYRQVLLLSGGCRSTDPRDAIFGLCSVIGGGIVPDYDKEVVDVFRECVAAVLRRDCKHFFHFAGLIRQGRDNSYFPSWVPRFHTLSEDKHFLINPKDTVLGAWPDGVCPDGLAILDNRTMRFSGVRLDRCARVMRHTGGEKTEFPGTLHRFWWLCLEFVGEYHVENSADGRQCLGELFHALCLGRDPRGGPLQITDSLHCITAHAFRMLLRMGEPEENALSVQELRSCGFASVGAAWAALDAAFVGPGAPDISTIRTTVANEEYELAISSRHFLAQMVFKWAQKPLFRTGTGCMGLAPPAIAEGDLVCLVKGFSTLCLLRRLDQHHHVLVGSCYVNGYSDGEPLQSLRDGDMTLEDFYIR